MRLTPGAEAAWMIAAGEAAAGGHPRIEPAHLMIGALSLGKLGTGTEARGVEVNAALVRDESDRLVAAVSGAGLDPTHLRRQARSRLGRGPVEGPPAGPLSRSLTCKAVFAAAEALAGEDRPVGVAHLFAALAEDVDAVTAQLIRSGGVDVGGLRTALLEAGRVATPPAPSPAATTPPELAAAPSATPVLDRFGRDLTELARRGELGPIVGRERETLAVLQELGPERRRSPLLVGEPGVGRKSIVEAIALRAVHGHEPGDLAGRRIVELSAGAVLAGAETPEAAARRVQDLVAECRARPEVVVFLDELHALLPPGREGPGPAAGNPLREALVRGEMRCIGATTPAEHRRRFEPDPPLARCFERVTVEETDRDETLEILKGLRPRLERHHGVSIPDEALAAAVDLTVRFDPDRRLPEKAIGLVDRASARTRLPLVSLVRPPAAGAAPPEAPPVTPVIVARVLAETRRLPLDLVTESLDAGMGSRLLSLEGFLQERVIGQREAVSRVARRLRLAFASPGGRQGPISVLLFLGPSGVGKTETARLLAEQLFGSASGMIRIDMAELMDEGGVTALVGVPAAGDVPGTEGRLTGAIRARSQALLLVEEVDKAHPRVLEVLLRLLEEGRLADASGRVVDGRHLVVILTSNLGTAAPRPTEGFVRQGPNDSGPPAPDLRGVFRLELLNRIDEIVTFRDLDPDEVEMVVRRALAEITSAVERRHGVRVRVTPEAARFAARQAALAAPGARAARRTVERLVNGPLSALVLTGQLTRHTAWAAVYDEGGIYLLPEG